ncbi:MAG: SsrA-binding protein SmpB [Candidatus Aminicenantes bacterium]|jgi:SsrA-binding protein|nr:MAG: SsrA-binding protein SmpB [Candidatus Aminicenantes bacterium]
MTDERRVLARNRKARHTYHILETEVAGMELLGTEVKAIRDAKVNIKEGYVTFVGGQAFLVGCHIGSYDNAGYAGHDPVRRRRLLLQKRQIERLASKVQEKGLTVVPLAVFLEGNWIKIEIALVRGKQLHDKRDTLRQRTMDREAEQDIKERTK